MRILIAGGGTGGHVYPALAVARSLLERRADLDLRWVGGHRGLESRVVPSAGIPVTRLALRSLRTVDASLPAVIDPFRLGASFPQAVALVGGLRPAAIFTTGGYVALPVATAARALHVPVLLWEGNVIPGRSVRVISRLAQVLAVSFPETCRRVRGRCYLTGTPVRDLSAVDRLAARRHFEIPADARALLIFGGSQSVQRFEAAVEEALPELVTRAVVLHVTGEAAYAAAAERRAALPEPLRERYRPYAFLREEMADALAAADLVVGRAGASTIAEVTALGTPLVLVPYPHAAGHQAANAQAVAAAGAAVVIPDSAFDGAALLEAAGILADPRRHLEMSTASRELARPGAAGAVAELVLALAERLPLPSADEIEARSRGAAA
jgi:UDP-N-acetylglucosamine--N-acetylmuramyl-(pentapeptide) pyrophosphoryl-undecaprenol N-acetylglucosamine transferase